VKKKRKNQQRVAVQAASYTCRESSADRLGGRILAEKTFFFF
jgi:hypothetical protein